MDICDPKGRDCIEANFPNSFNCSTTCVGIYANVWWVAQNIDKDMVESDDAGEADPIIEGNDDLHKRIAALERRLERMEGKIGKKGEEMDKDKYKTIISEYRKFKAKNVRHFRFSSAAVTSDFSKSTFDQTKIGSSFSY